MINTSDNNSDKSRKDPANERLRKIPVQLLIAAGIGLVTWMFLKSCLVNQFTNWDDPGYIIANPLVKDLSVDGLESIFSTSVMGNYHPLTILTYALEYSFVQLEPWLYHFDSLWLHLLVTMLVYCFVSLLTKRPIAAIVTALLFGLHPMHIETVAWVSGRKDLVTALFYLSACIFYVKYIRVTGGRKWGLYTIVIVLFAAALLSKAIAVTLPLALLLIDYFENRPRTKIVILEKIPLFLLSIIFGIISINAQHSFGAIRFPKASYNLFERLAAGSYALITYLWKAIIPAKLCCFYPYPQTATGGLPIVYYIYPVVLIALVIVIWKFAGKNKVFVFGLLFFVANIALLLQFLPVGESFLAERYSYIPYIGLFFIPGWYISNYFEQGKVNPRGIAVSVCFILYTISLGYFSRERCKVWYDSTTLWRDELNKEPRVQAAYDNLISIYFDRWYTNPRAGDSKVYYDSAFYLLHRSIELWPDSPAACQPLAMLYYYRHKDDSAVYYFSKTVRLKPTGEEYLNYGNFLVMLGRKDSALNQFTAAISKAPDMYAPYLNRAKILRANGSWGDAMRDLNTVIRLKPDLGEPYYERSFCDTQLGVKNIALRDVEHAISLGYNKVDTGYFNWLRK